MGRAQKTHRLSRFIRTNLTDDFQLVASPQRSVQFEALNPPPAYIFALPCYIPARENEPSRSVQRWRHGHSHYHHGPGVEGAARSDPGFPGEDVADLFCLCSELHHHRHLLGQSSSSHSPRHPGRLGHSLGEYQSALLDLAHPLGHDLSRRQSRPPISGCALCGRLDGGRHFFFPAARIDRPSSSRAGVPAVEQKNGTQEPHRHSRLYRGHRRRVHLHPARPGHDRVPGHDVFPAGTRVREIRALGLCHAGSYFFARSTSVERISADRRKSRSSWLSSASLTLAPSARLWCEKT